MQLPTHSILILYMLSHMGGYRVHARTQPPLTIGYPAASNTAGLSADQIEVPALTSYAAKGQQLIMSRVGGMERLGI